MILTAPEITNYATVGKQRPLSIYGYGPINSDVSLRGFGMSERTTSDTSGFFRFTEIYSFTYTYPELCLQSVDDQKRVTQPTCIPPLPNNSIIPLEVGPILLSPTLSLDGNRVTEGDTVVLDGRTTPNTLVNVYLSRSNSQTNLSLVKEANAYSLPVVNTKSDEVGSYEITLPTGDQTEYKVFTSSKFGENFSAKSNTLQFAVVSGFRTWLTRLIDFILANKMMIVIIAEAIIVIVLLVLALKSTTKRKRRHTERDYLEYLKF